MRYTLDLTAVNAVAALEWEYRREDAGTTGGLVSMPVDVPEDLYRWIVTSSVDGIVCADRAGMILIWNGGAAKYLGYAAEEAIGQSLNLVLPEACRERHWVAFHRWFATGEDRIDEPFGVIPLIHRDGTTVRLESTFVRVRDDRGEPVAAGAIIRPAGLSAG